MELPPFPDRGSKAPNSRRAFRRTDKHHSRHIKRENIAWFASHRHNSDGTNALYCYSYLFAYPIDILAGAKTLTLPKNDKIRIVAVTVAEVNATAYPVYSPFTALLRVDSQFLWNSAGYVSEETQAAAACRQARVFGSYS